MRPKVAGFLFEWDEIEVFRIAACWFLDVPRCVVCLPIKLAARGRGKRGRRRAYETINDLSMPAADGDRVSGFSFMSVFTIIITIINKLLLSVINTESFR